MSVTVKDFRRNQAEHHEEAKPEHKPIEQVHVEESRLTGDVRLDKLTRAIEKKVQELEKVAGNVAQQTAAMIKDEEIRKGQMIFAYHQGLLFAYKDVMNLPAQIIVEEKL